MQAWLEMAITSGLMIDIILGIMLAELVIFGSLMRPRLKAWRVASVIVPGACIFLALRAALTAAGWQLIAFWLVAAGLAHGFDLWHRWRELHVKDSL